MQVHGWRLLLWEAAPIRVRPILRLCDKFFVPIPASFVAYHPFPPIAYSLNLMRTYLGLIETQLSPLMYWGPAETSIRNKDKRAACIFANTPWV